MYSSRFLKLINFQIRCAYFWGACPFRYNSTKRSVHVTLLGRCHLAFLTSVIFVFTLLFLPQQIYRYRQPEHFDQFNLAVVIWILIVLANGIFIFIFFNSQEFCYIFNVSLRFVENFLGNLKQN